MDVLSVFGILAAINVTIITFIGSVLLAFYLNDEQQSEVIRKKTQNLLNDFIEKTSYKKFYGINLFYEKKEDLKSDLEFHISRASNDSDTYPESYLEEINRSNEIQKNEIELIESSITLTAILYNSFTNPPFFRESEVDLKYIPKKNDIERIKDVKRTTKIINHFFHNRIIHSKRSNIKNIQLEINKLSKSNKTQLLIEKESIDSQNFESHLKNIKEEIDKNYLPIITGISDYLLHKELSIAKNLINRFLKVGVFQFFFGITIPLIFYIYLATVPISKSYVYYILCANIFISLLPYSYQLGKLASTHNRHTEHLKTTDNTV